MPVLPNDLAGYHWQLIGTILVSILQLAEAPLKLCMATVPATLASQLSMLFPFQFSRSGWQSVITWMS